VTRPSADNLPRIDRAHGGDFDEQLWPINLVILVLAGIAAGFVGMTSEFPDPEGLDFTNPAILQTGWGRLAAVGATCAAAMVSVLLLQRWMARRVLLCLLLGLLIHLWLGVYLHDRYLEGMEQRARAERELLLLEDDQVVMPDYHISQVAPTDEPQSFEKPVETEPPQESQPLELEKIIEEHEVVVEQPAPVPQTLPKEPPAPLQLDRLEQTVPLESETSSGIELSRQVTPDRPEPDEAIPQPEVPKTAPAPAPNLAARAAQAQRRIEQAPAPDRLRPNETADVPRQVQLEMQRVLSDPALAQSALQPLVRQAREIDSTVPDLPSPDVPAQATPEPNRQPGQTASQVARNRTSTPAQRQASAVDVGATAETPHVIMPESRRTTILPQANEISGLANRTVGRTSAAMRPHTALPDAVTAPKSGTQSDRTLEAGTGTTAQRQAASASAPVSAPVGAAGGAAAMSDTEVAAALGRPRTDMGARPAFESGGAGNPLSRSARSLPSAQADLPSLDQAAATGSGEGVRPDTALDAAVAGPTRRTAGTTTEMSMGRPSPDPPSGTLWGERASSAPLERATTADQRAAPSGASGGGRSVLARSNLAAGRPLQPAPIAVDAMGSPGQPSGENEPTETDVASADGGRAGSFDARGAIDSAAMTPGRNTATGGPIPRIAGGSPPTEGATSPEPMITGVRRQGGPTDSETLLAMSGATRVPKASLSGAGLPTVEVPFATDLPGEVPNRDTTARPGAGPASTLTERRQAGPMVPIRQPMGPGGLSDPAVPTLGIPEPHARPESVVVHTTPGRFMLDRAAGRPLLDAALIKPPAAAFRQRFPGTRNETARKYGATESSDLAVEQGLFFLLRCQFPDGRWAVDRLPQGVVTTGEDVGLGEMNADTAATGLALLAFLGKGYTHTEGKYRNQVNAGLKWLVANQQADGRLFSDESDRTLYAQFYGHGIATIALGEAYGMTWDESLREPLERAIQFTLDSQHPERGAWRYRPRQESDTSVSGWHTMALKSAQMAGLEVPTESLARVSAWLDLAQGQDGSRYRYNPYALDNAAQRQGRVPSLAMTAEGLLMRLYLDRDRNHPEMIAGADYLRENLPAKVGETRSMRDVYYLYYATQVMFQMQGKYWTDWNARLRPLLESTQVPKGQLIGSWDPNGPVRDRWGHAGGRLYVTAMNLLMLEVYYRHMPLFRELDQ